MTATPPPLGPCFYCDATVGPFVRDHFVPKSRGGTDAVWNRVVACVGCDRRKGDLHPRDWLRICPQAGRGRVHDKLLALGLSLTADAGERGRRRDGQRKKKSPPRDGRSTSDGPGSWYGQVSEEAARFHLESIERWIARPLPPAPSSDPALSAYDSDGALRPLRVFATRYLSHGA